MNDKHIVLIQLAALTLCGAGCADRAEKEKSLVEKTTKSETTVTSTATPIAIEVADPGASETPPGPAVPDEPSKADEPSTKQIAFEPDLGSSDGLSLQRFVTTSTIEGREPTGADAVFQANVERVYAFIEARNESSSPKTLLVYFLGPGEKVSGGIELEIPASVPRWRTWAYTRHAKEPGLWRVEVRDLNGALVGALPFEIEPGQ